MSDLIPYEEHEAALTDLVGAEREVRRLRRVVANLERERAVSEDDPQAEYVQTLLETWWVEVKGSNPRVAYELESDRAPKVKAALKRRTTIARKKKAEDPERAAFDLCRRAVLGVRYDDWAMGRIKKSGGKCFNDIAEHILNTDADIEKFARLFDAREQPAPRRPRLSVAVGDAVSRGEAPPLATVLHAFTVGGVEWRRRAEDEWVARCPAHEGRSLWLTVARRTDGTVWLDCAAGCVPDTILGRVGLDFRALWANCEMDRDARGFRPVEEREARMPAHLVDAMRDLVIRNERVAVWDRRTVA